MRGVAVDDSGEVLAAIESGQASGFRRFTETDTGWQAKGGLVGNLPTHRADDVEASPDGTVYLDGGHPESAHREALTLGQGARDGHVPDLVAHDIAVGPSGDVYAFQQNTGIVHFAEDKSKPGTANVPGKIAVSKGKATVKYTASGIACPEEVDATFTLKGAGVAGKGAGKVAAGKATPLKMTVKGPAGKTVKATFTIVLKTNGRPTTETKSVTVSFAK